MAVLVLAAHFFEGCSQDWRQQDQHQQRHALCISQNTRKGLGRQADEYAVVKLITNGVRRSSKVVEEKDPGFRKRAGRAVV